MNEATFRKVNEGMEAGQDPSGLLTFVCECGRLGCNKLIQLTRPEYEGIRENPRRFAILDGHEILEAVALDLRHAADPPPDLAGAPGGRRSAPTVLAVRARNPRSTAASTPCAGA
jgi:hypothetical protein